MERVRDDFNLLSAVVRKIERMRVVELEPAVVDGVRSVMGELPIFSDPRVEIIFDDARSARLLESQRYDVIVATVATVATVASLARRERAKERARVRKAKGE